MAGPLTVRDIEDIGFQRKEWLVQRVAWVLLALVAVGALAGVLGAGPVSETTAESEDGTVEVTYDQFIRNLGTTIMTISLGQETVNNGKAQLFISHELAESWRLNNVSPAPSTESSSDDWLIYEFDVLGETPPTVKFVYMGDRLGVHHGPVRAGDGASVNIWQLIYP